MDIKCRVCSKKLLDKEIDEYKPEQSKCRECYIKWLRINISHLSDSLCYMQLELKQLLGEFQEWSDTDDDDDEEEHFYLDNINGI